VNKTLLLTISTMLVAICGFLTLSQQTHESDDPAHEIASKFKAMRLAVQSANTNVLVLSGSGDVENRGRPTATQRVSGSGGVTRIDR
jgi:hypothetical protein